MKRSDKKAAARGVGFWPLWGWPLGLGVLTVSGLVSALVSDGWGDVWSWLALGAPVAVMAWYGWRLPRRPPSR